MGAGAVSGTGAAAVAGAVGVVIAAGASEGVWDLPWQAPIGLQLLDLRKCRDQPCQGLRKVGNLCLSFLLISS